MATAKLASTVRQLPKEAKALIAKGLVGSSLEKLGKVRVFPLGIPVDEWVVSVLPKTALDAKKIIDALVARPGLGRFEVFPYGIINPEIGRIDVTIKGRA
jgi:hypothetical protein